MTDEALISIVDDDAGVRDALRRRLLLESDSYTVKAHASARQFLDDKQQANCLIADVRMPEMDGLELQEEIARRGTGVPVIIMTAYGDVPLAVRALKAGAVDFIEKPFDDEQLVSSVRRAIEIGRKARAAAAEAAAADRLLALLTPRERTVLDQLIVGHSNKVAAYELGISPRTVEIHRAHIMGKMNAHSLSDLVRVSLAASGHAA